MILAGDIGGTKTNLGLFEARDGACIRRISIAFRARNTSGWKRL